MLSTLSVMLAAAVLLLVPATVLVFTVGSAARRAARSRPTPVVVVAVPVALASLGVGAVLGAGPIGSAVAGAALGGSVLAWQPACRAWSLRGLLAWALTVDAGVTYLAYVAAWTLTADLSATGLAASAALWLLEAFVLLIGLGYAWEFVDVLARVEWTAYVDPRRLEDRSHRPFVSLHVPTHNEPPDLVVATIERLLQLEYDAYEVVVIDNNTTDPALWRPVEEFCRGRDRVRFVHVEDWPGFKSGALNHALQQHTDPRAEVIGIVDADYLVEPDFLSDCAPLFADPEICFVQTPQDYRGWEAAPYFRRLYHSYGYFFDVSQKSRNERNGAIFGGTMGLIRRTALSAVGGWDEWCITEDAELSLRLLRSGGRGVHVDRSYGYGVMPLTFEALKRQRFRWCFGGVQILRLHWRSLLAGRRTEANRLSLGQRWAYLVGGLQWFGDLASVLFTGFLLLGSLDLVWGGGVVVRRLSGLLLLCVLALLVLGAVRSLALVRRTSGATWAEAIGAFGLWLALGWAVAQGAVRGLFAREGVFLRTPKVRGQLRASYALRGNLVETTLGVVCAAAGVLAIAQLSAPAALVGGLLLVQATGFLLAPANSLAAIRSELPEELRRRRRLLLASWGRPARRGGLALATAGAVLVGVVVSAAPVAAPELTDILPAPSPSRPLVLPGRAPSDTSSGVSGDADAPDAEDAGAATGAPASGSPSGAPAGQPAPTGGPAPTQPTQAAQPTQASQPTQAPTAPGGAATSPTQWPTTRPTDAATVSPSGGGRARSTATRTATSTATSKP